MSQINEEPTIINIIESSIENPNQNDPPDDQLSFWQNLPEPIRSDPALAEFRASYQRHLSGDGSRSNSPFATLQPTSSKTHSAPRTRQNLSVNALRGAWKSKSHDGKLMVRSFEGGLDEDFDDLASASIKGFKGMVRKNWIRIAKCGFLLLIWLIFTLILMAQREKISYMHQISVPENHTRSYWIVDHPVKHKIFIVMEGAFLPAYYSNLSSKSLTVWMELLETNRYSEVSTNLSSFTASDITYNKNISETWILPLVSEELIDFVPEVKLSKTLELYDFEFHQIPHTLLRLKMRTNMECSLPVALAYDISPIDLKDGIIYAALVLAGLYLLIIFEVVHRTVAAMLASTMSVAILAALNERPTMAELISWIDIETLLLLFSMMVLVAILSETGIFDYLAVFAYRITGGRVWPLIITLCLFTALLSSVLDNVTTVLLMTPVTIRLCEVLGLNPVPILTSMIIYSNIGGAVTPVGDPPNVIIASHPDVIESGVDFGVFTLHIGIGVCLVVFVTYIHLRIIFRDMDDLGFSEPHDIQELRHEIAIWQRAAASLSSYSKEEDVVRETLLKKTRRLLNELKQKITSGGSVTLEKYHTTLEELEAKYPIRDKVLLAKSSFTLVFVITLFFLHSIPGLNLSLGWTALLGAILLMLLADNHDIEGLLARVEWSTLLFFASLFVLMECLSRLGLIDWIGRQTESIILAANKDARLAVAILLILWVSAIASAFVDNIPFATMMIRVVTSLAKNPELDLPLQPLVWALVFGACFGGNGTLIGASANVVCAGVAEQHGYRFTFIEYFKVGFPVMIVSIIVITVYLMVSHVAFAWH